MAGSFSQSLAEPERVIIFRVPWVDDKGEIIVSDTYRHLGVNSVQVLDGGTPSSIGASSGWALNDVAWKDEEHQIHHEA